MNVRNLNKVILAHKTVGAGECKIIALHSWLDDAESWNPLIPYLDYERFTFLFVDLRGYGKSKKLLGNYNAQEVINDIFNLADELGWKKFNLIGHSMSGLVAQKAALMDFFNRIEKIALITPVSSAGFTVNQENKNFFISIIQNLNVAKSAYEIYTSNLYTENWATKRAIRHLEITDEKAQLGYLKMWVKEDFKDKMSDVNKPFLVIAGKNDFFKFNLDNQKIAFENFRNVKFDEIESAGHFPMEETPILLVSKLEKFFSS